jgi:serine/threonine protein kinase
LNPEFSKFLRGLIGQTIKERYKIERVLGHGSFGNVFLVYDENENNEE